MSMLWIRLSRRASSTCPPRAVNRLCASTRALIPGVAIQSIAPRSTTMNARPWSSNCLTMAVNSSVSLSPTSRTSGRITAKLSPTRTEVYFGRCLFMTPSFGPVLDPAGPELRSGTPTAGCPGRPPRNSPMEYRRSDPPPVTQGARRSSRDPPGRAKGRRRRTLRQRHVKPCAGIIRPRSGPGSGGRRLRDLPGLLPAGDDGVVDRGEHVEHQRQLGDDEQVVDALVDAGEEHARAALGEALVRIHQRADAGRADPVDGAQVHDHERELLLVQLLHDGLELVGLLVAHPPMVGPDHGEVLSGADGRVLRALLVHASPPGPPRRPAGRPLGSGAF